MSPSNSANASLNVRQILFNGSVVIGLGAAAVYSDLTRDVFRQKTVETVAKVRKAYYAALLAKEALTMMRSNLTNAEANLNNVRLLRAQGIVSEYDELRASVGVDNLRPAVIFSESNFALALDNLRNMMGMPDTVLVVPSDSLAFTEVDEGIIASAHESVLSSNPALSIIQHQIALNGASINAERSNFFPTVVAYGSYSYTAIKDDLRISTNDFYAMSQVGVTVSLNLFQGLQTNYRIEQAQLERQKSEEQQRGLERNLQLGIRSIVGTLRQSRKRIGAQEKTVEAAIAGADLRLTKQQMGPPVGSPVSIEVSGEECGLLAEISDTIKSVIGDIPGLVDIKDDYNTGRPEIEVVVDREKAGLFSTSTGQIASTVRAAIAGVEASKYRVGEDECKIRVRLKEDQLSSAADLENLRINFMNRRGQLLSIPLTSVADIRRTTSVTDIRRKDQKRVITVSGDVAGRVQSEVLNDVKLRIAGLQLPNGYSVKLTGSEEEQKKASDFLRSAFITTLLLVFLIMVMEFNSLKVPLVIMFSVIFSLIGVLFGLIVTQTPLSVMMTGVGIVALAGIVVRNGIILLDFVKHKHNEGGMSVDAALVEAGRVRLRPVLFTAAAAVLALIPMGTGIDFNWSAFRFVSGSESAGFWRPLAVAIIFGLTISTVLTLIVVPTAYSLIDEYSEKLIGWLRQQFGEE